jgi:hypothetical protein
VYGPRRNGDLFVMSPRQLQQAADSAASVSARVDAASHAASQQSFTGVR